MQTLNNVKHNVVMASVCGNGLDSIDDLTDKSCVLFTTIFSYDVNYQYNFMEVTIVYFVEYSMKEWYVITSQLIAVSKQHIKIEFCSSCYLKWEL